MSYAYSFGGITAEPAACEPVERKVCEGGCGGLFYRRTPAMAKLGEKLCEKCRAKTPERLAIECGSLMREIAAGFSRRGKCFQEVA